mmetsp:Transcript_14498/g.26235  ORF Transcript_14498/g.26235 Transcript_14498/m.26235 type:complete len:212 (-) Transcript_14498:86-721(-)
MARGICAVAGCSSGTTTPLPSWDWYMGWPTRVPHTATFLLWGSAAGPRAAARSTRSTGRRPRASARNIRPRAAPAAKSPPQRIVSNGPERLCEIGSLRALMEACAPPLRRDMGTVAVVPTIRGQPRACGGGRTALTRLARSVDRRTGPAGFGVPLCKNTALEWMGPGVGRTDTQRTAPRAAITQKQSKRPGDRRLVCRIESREGERGASSR